MIPQTFCSPFEDLLMLDEPTKCVFDLKHVIICLLHPTHLCFIAHLIYSHLDLEAVLWLESYLQSYRHTVIVVSHDRAFLNEVCTDTVCPLSNGVFFPTLLTFAQSPNYQQ